MSHPLFATTTDDVLASWRAIPIRRGRFKLPPHVAPSCYHMLTHACAVVENIFTIHTDSQRSVPRVAYEEVLSLTWDIIFDSLVCGPGLGLGSLGICSAWECPFIWPHPHYCHRLIKLRGKHLDRHHHSVSCSFSTWLVFELLLNF